MSRNILTVSSLFVLRFGIFSFSLFQFCYEQLIETQAGVTVILSSGGSLFQGLEVKCI